MVRNITRYPTQTGFDFGGTVRHFDDALLSLIQDMKDTIEANKLEGLAAFQIGSPLNVIVVKHEDSYLEIINPVIFSKEGEITPTETTAYFPHITVLTKRAKSIKLTYENIHGEQQFLTAHDALSILIQRKNDYLLGSTFIVRLSNEEKEKLENTLAGKKHTSSSKISCPTSLPSEKILSVIKYALIVGLIGIFVYFILPENLLGILKTLETYIMEISILLILGYFFYAQYEGKKYSNCTTCQLSNIMALTLIKSIHLSGLFLLNYWLLF